MGLELIELVPIFMVFILYFLGMPIVYALFGSTFFYFTFIFFQKNFVLTVLTKEVAFSHSVFVQNKAIHRCGQMYGFLFT